MARRKNPGGKPGNQGKGDRAAITVRVPLAHKDRYAREARRLGLPVSDYLALQMAEAHGLDTPTHLLPRQDEQLAIGA